MKQFVIDVVKEASELALAVQKEMVTPTTVEKADKSPVTVCDLAIQALISRRLAEQFPNDALVGEESNDVFAGEDGQKLLGQVTGFVQRFEPSETPSSVASWIERGRDEGDENRYWVLDPVDGTKGFLRRNQYAIALGLTIDKQPVLGALGCPCWQEGTVYFASQGEGAYSIPLHGTDLTPIHVSDVSDASLARVLRSVEKGHTNVGQIDYIVEKLNIKTDPVSIDSQVKYGVLASGGAEILLRLISPKMPNYKEKIWDQCAGVVVLQEAGGRVTDLDGKPLDFTHGRTLAENRGVCATNGKIHSAVLDAIAAVGA
ncbi:MAG: 3'(2'),5'-bisphosphate nucleotidase [Thermoguttaceae bacterium]|nr:3'(2'),5'-bisphosphate nucleotidase [Thermoguttaceae bacterium]